MLFMLSPYLGVGIGLYLLQSAFAAILLYHAGIIGAFLTNRGTLQYKAMINFKDVRFATFIPFCLISGALIYLLWPIINSNRIEIAEETARYGLEGIKFLLFIAYFSLIHPILEEGFWRFFIDPKNPRHLWAEILFSGYHFLVLRLFIPTGWAILCVVSLIGIARFWRFMKQNQNEGLMVIATHAAADFSIILAVYLLTK